MKTWDEAKATARPGAAFSNGFEWESWAEAHCWACVHYEPNGSADCLLPDVAMLDQVTPAEWTETNPGGLADRYTCSDFEAIAPEPLNVLPPGSVTS